jgi:hypothetical protein
MQKLYGEETNRPRVLIIEDDTSTRALIHEALLQVGIDAAINFFRDPLKSLP